MAVLCYLFEPSIWTEKKKRYSVDLSAEDGEEEKTLYCTVDLGAEEKLVSTEDHELSDSFVFIFSL